MISIIIPTIKKTLYFKEAFESAIETQTEICSQILIMDNSQDPLWNQEIQNLCKVDSRVSIISHATRLSMAKSWNHSLSFVTQEWVIYLHDDDVLEISNFEAILQKLNSSLGYVSFDFYKLVKNKKTLIKRNPGLNGIIENTPKFVSTFFNTEKLRSINGFNDEVGYYLDALCFIQLHQRFGSQHVSLPLGSYRIHETNASSRDQRAKGYGEALPDFLKLTFLEIPDSCERKALCFHAVSFAFPHQSFWSRLLNVLIRLTGNNAWFLR